MLYLNKEDYFEVYLGSMVSNIGRDTLIALYQPIIGHDAVSLYLTLFNEFKKQRFGNISTIEDLLLIMDISISSLQEAKANLEGIGLLQSYYMSKNHQNFYKYVLLAPKTPSEFFGDLLFRGLLVRAIGEKKTNQLNNLYKSKAMDLEGYEEVTASFKDVFHPNFDSADFRTRIDNDETFTYKVKDISKGFDRGAFVSGMETKYGFVKSFFKKKVVDEIARIALLYGIDEDAMTDYVSQAYDEGSKQIDFEKVKKLAYNDMYFIPTGNVKVGKEVYDGSSLIAKKLEMLSSYSTIDYLALKQQNTAPSPSDLAIINTISNEYHLPASVINVIVDYTLEKCDNVLVRNFALKVAASLKRKNISTAEDAMNDLSKSRSSYTISSTPTVVREDKEELSAEELDNLLDDLGD